MAPPDSAVLPENSYYLIFLTFFRSEGRLKFPVIVVVVEGSRTMKPILSALLAYLSSLFRSRTSLQFKIVALRHQLTVYQRATQHPRTKPGDRVLWSWIVRHWSGWRDSLVFVQARTVIAWQHKRFREHWTKLSKPGRPLKNPYSISFLAGVNNFFKCQNVRSGLVHPAYSILSL